MPEFPAEARIPGNSDGPATRSSGFLTDHPFGSLFVNSWVTTSNRCNIRAKMSYNGRKHPVDVQKQGPSVLRASEGLVFGEIG